MNTLHYSSLLSLGLLLSFSAQAQSEAAQIVRRADGTPELVTFERSAAPRTADAAAAFRTTLGLGQQSELRPLRAADTDELGLTHQRYQQYYQGVPVEFTAYTTHSRDGKIEFMTGETRLLADGALSVQPRLTADEALRAALAFVHATKYQWEMPNEGKFAQETEGKSTFRPTGELVIVDNIFSMDKARLGKPVLAWKFNIYAAEPVSRDYIYVDAQTGEVVNQDAIIKHATASFTTKYSGTRSLTNSQVGILPIYNLRDASRGQGVQTFNLQKGNSVANATDFFDSNNVWTAAEYNNANQDWVAGDAHFGAQMTYDYWKNVHARNSFDGAGALMKSYVHYDDTPGDGKGLDNAFWNGSIMLYGDGNVMCRPLTSLDVCGHEVGHAICQFTAGLQYQNESGGLNEGFSDIWGACVEQRAAGLFGLAGKSTWDIGEEIMLSGNPLRSMSNPKSRNQPDTYQGDLWVMPVATPVRANDFGGVHTNSGVLNYWFYLMSQGGSGTNDKGNAYTVSGVGITAAAKIAYLTEKLLSPTSGFNTARTMSLQAVTTLYGANSAHYKAVANAWYAVGVGYSVAFGSAGNTYIDAVALEQLARFSTSDVGYFDGVAAGTTAAQLKRCSTYSLLHSAGFSSGVGTRYWNVYIDFNQDKDFNDAGERVITNKVSTDGAWIASSFNVPSTALLGTTRMRISMSNIANNVTCGSIIDGEVEDYSVTIGATAAVSTPLGLHTTSTTATSANLVWTSLPNIPSYGLRYRISGAVVWMTTTSVTNAKALTGLIIGKNYEVQVRAINACGTTGAYSPSVFFSTAFIGRPAGTTTDESPAAAVTVEAYPNPATDVLHLTLGADLDGNVPTVTDVIVYDLRGARVQQVRYDGNGTLRLDGLPPGLYTATVLGGSAPASVRFVKE